ncbi:MAG: hypothetical protein ACRDY3_05330 [Acidimicrobiales bacterium]
MKSTRTEMKNSKKKKMFSVAGVATGAAGMALMGLGVAMPPVAGATTSGATTYTAALKPVPLNGQTKASGTLKLVLTGTKATVTEHATGLAATFTGKPFPHVQHIHGLAKGACPTASTKNRTGVISTVDAQPTYGMIQTTLSVTPGGTTAGKGTTITIAPKGASYTYSRTFTLSATALKAVQAHNAVIVVHGLTPSTAPKAATTLKSTLVPTLPLAATAPALCGQLVASQMSAVPSGAPQTGGGSTSGVQDVTLFGVGGGLLVAGAGLLTARRRLRSTH